MHGGACVHAFNTCRQWLPRATDALCCAHRVASMLHSASAPPPRLLRTAGHVVHAQHGCAGGGQQPAAGLIPSVGGGRPPPGGVREGNVATGFESGYALKDSPGVALFLDDSFVEASSGLERGVEPARKLPGPALLVCDQPWETWEMSTYINVIFDNEEKIFKMWYSVIRDNLRSGYGEVRGEEAFALCYANSIDGQNWKKPILNLVKEDGSTANNLVWPFYRWGGGHGVLKDAAESDPARRYKMLFTLSTVEMSAVGITQPLCAAFSPDGIVWSAIKGWVNPVIPTGTDTQAAVFYDESRRKYMVYLRGRPNVRVIAVAESADFLSWTERVVVVQPDADDPPQNREFYGMASMAYRGHRIGFLSVYHTLYENWIAQNSVEEWMPDWIETMDIQLTYSMDGSTYYRAGGREPILQCGPPGSRDSATVYPPNAPFEHDGEIWLFYHGNNMLHGEATRRGEAPEGGLYLAKIQKDRLVCLRTAEVDRTGCQDEGSKPGDFSSTPAILTTIPLTVDPKRLRINVTVRPGGWVKVALLDPWQRPLPGCELEAAVPIVESGVEVPVQWERNYDEDASEDSGEGGGKGGGLEEKMVNQPRGTVKVLLHMHRASLFAVYTM